MRKLLTIGLGLIIINCTAQKQKPTLKSVLLEQLQYTHTEEDWFAPTSIALEGVTAEQASWKDSTDNHSIRQLVSHLVFWNERVLVAFKGNTLPDFTDENEETFETYNNLEWSLLTAKFDIIQTKWEQEVAKASDEQVSESSYSIANVGAHNAYHTGQIVYIRKRNGWWKTEN